MHVVDDVVMHVVVIHVAHMTPVTIMTMHSDRRRRGRHGVGLLGRRRRGRSWHDGRRRGRWRA